MRDNNLKSKPVSATYPVLVITLCACFLFYKYVLQIYPSIITDQLMNEFHLTGAGLGNLAATFYYAYMVTQLFVGVILDKYGARWITSAAIFSCALGVFLFSRADTVLTAGLSRALMGVGVSFATVAYMKLGSIWFPPKRYAFIAGLLATACMAGAIFGQAPLAWVVNHLGWRLSLFMVGVVGFFFAVYFFLVVRDAPVSKQSHSTENNPSVDLKDIIQVFKNKQNWLLTLYAGLAFTPIAVFGGLWGNPFLQLAYHLTKTQAASFVSLVFFGLGIGSPLLGMFSDFIKNRAHVMFGGTFLSGVAITLVLYCHPMPLWLMGTLLFMFGFCLGAFPIVFAIGKELNSVALTATVIAMINASDGILTAVTEPGIGRLLDLGWEGKIVNGVHYFSLHSYHLALGTLPVYLFISAMLMLWVKDNAKALSSKT